MCMCKINCFTHMHTLSWAINYDELRCVDYIQVNTGPFGIVEYCGSLRNSQNTFLIAQGICACCYLYIFKTGKLSYY